MDKYTKAYEFLQKAKENETSLSILMHLEKLGCEIPKDGPIDIKKVLEEAGRQDVIEMLKEVDELKGLI